MKMPDHKVINDVREGKLKRCVDVRVGKRMSLAALRVLAMSLREPEHAKTFVNVYLPGQVIGQGAWGVVIYGAHIVTDTDVTVFINEATT